MKLDEVARLERELAQALAEVERLRQAGPMTFKGVEIPWDNDPLARRYLEERDAARRDYIITLDLLKVEIEKFVGARAALRVAHHALTTVHGLWATDVTNPLNIDDNVIYFRIDVSKALAVIEEAMGDG